MECMLLLFYLFVLFCSSYEGTINNFPPNVTFPPAIFAFGDSIVDQGSNNEIKTLSKCNFPPYGKNFEGGLPTGRFSNGKTPLDFIAELLGIKELVPAYFDPDLNSSDLKTGVSFASGGSGYDPLTSKIFSVIPLSKQLESFKEYIEKLKGIVGEKEANLIVTSSLYILSSGSNDFINYFNVGGRRLQYEFASYADELVGLASNYIQEIYKLGGRRIAVFSFPPFGCLPAERTLFGGITRKCVEKLNQAAILVNAKLSSEIDLLTKNLPQSKVVCIDIYNPLLDFIQNPKIYGLEVVDKGCCGTGTIEVAVLCNKYSNTCPNNSAYLFWDSVHPTETGYRILTDYIIPKYVDKLL